MPKCYICDADMEIHREEPCDKCIDLIAADLQDDHMLTPDDEGLYDEVFDPTEYDDELG